ncbi:MarR family winged helix-turn-helix transcriptional regulator [Corynebacterium liangguodongii]|uniref:MarR family transcriptional regulator n=1 Tax=Corynebacterium liangguodongii TaxID=2079535 RepID=A0A2S0WDH6_9CORY|nr:MarR family winged helix-turn-helix transcriptional regulator [Corynebacterium liangguodongii]AWB83816.1 MarR family transcriptional regulator [Corynebacterium liangguodongii]PWB98937.1 MarR family transcriptional regulator [Corynebacterium liangguodongii]
MAQQPRWLNDDEQDLWRLMLSASRKLNRVIEETLQATSDLSASEFGVLVALSEAPGHELRLRDLCVALEWDRSRTSHQVTRMEKRGLLTKSKCPGDARGVLVQLTEDGMRRVTEAAPDHVESVRRVVFDHLGREDAAALRRFLSGIIEVDNVLGASPRIPACQRVPESTLGSGD